jgi:hypothetical protein
VNVRIALLAFAGLALLAGPAAARPYLMLYADDQGFKAMDLGGIDRAQPGRVEVTLIEAPLGGAPVDGKLAPLIQRRVQVSCLEDRWRQVAQTYLDGREAVMAKQDTQDDWRPFGSDETAPVIKTAACQRVYRQQAVSRYLNLGEILANYQAAHAKAKPQPLTEKEITDRAYRNGR